MMVEPTKFFFNAETAKDNEFMHDVQEDNEVIAKQAIEEHQTLRKRIEEAGVEVVKYIQQEEDLPDSLFPNNWISTHKYPGLIENRVVCVYPMKAPTRQREVNYKIVDEFMEASGHCIDMTSYCDKELALEGTGVLIFDAPNKKIYANISQRCEKEVLEHFLELFNSKSKEPFRLVTFTAKTHSDTAIYHTNVMLSILSDHAVICLESIQDEEERDKVIEELTSSELNDFPRKIIDISLEEVGNMCGNIICVIDKAEQPCVIMPSTAYYGYTSSNRDELETHYKIVHADVSTIEKIGGGSARCMVAEVF